MAQIIVTRNGHRESFRMFTFIDVASAEALHKEIRITTFNEDHSEESLYRLVLNREEAISLMAQLAIQIANV